MYSEEQQAVIEAASNGNSVSVRSIAGSGKTHTVIGAANGIMGA